jgi:hypothetical protein
LPSPPVKYSELRLVVDSNTPDACALRVYPFLAPCADWSLADFPTRPESPPPM